MKNDSTLCYQANLFIAGLPITVRLNTMHEIFEHHDIVAEYFHIVRRDKDGKPRVKALAFVRLVNADDTAKAIEKLNNIVIDEHKIAVRKYIARADRERARAVFHSVPVPTWAKHVAGETEAAQ